MTTNSKFKKWVQYWNHVSNRIHFDKGLLLSAVKISQVYLHFLPKKIGLTNGGADQCDRTTLAFHPHPVGPWYTIWMALQTTSIKRISSAQSADVVFHFDDQTETANPSSLMQGEALTVNARITDIRKSHVGEVFETVFGYPLEVNPLTYTGKAVCKSNENGTHDGFVLDLPISPDAVRSGCSYQVLVDSTFSGKTAEDLRIAYVFGEIVFVYHKHKALDVRFGTTYLSTVIVPAVDVFSADEIEKIHKFCEAMGLEFGAADIMRDKVSGRIYIVDVNKTCMPVLSLPKDQLLNAVEQIGTAFEAGVMTRLQSV